MRVRIPSLLSFAIAVSCTKPADERAAGHEVAPPKQAPADEPKVVEAKPAALTPGVAEDGSIVSAVTWFEGGLEAGIAQAKADGKLVLVDVGAYWCPPCQQLDEEVFTDPAVGAFVAERFVAVHVDAEKGDGPEIVDQYRVQAYPTVVVLDAQGLEKGRVVDFLPAAAFIDAVTRAAEGADVLAALVEAVQADPDDVQARYRLGNAYALATRRREAEEQFEAVLVADPKDELGLASKVLYDRAMFFTYKLDGQPREAIAAFEHLQQTYPESAPAIRAYRAMGRILNELGEVDAAIAKLDAMLAVDPGDRALAASYGWFSFRQRCRPDRALQVVEAALERDGEDAELQYLRAELLARVGRGAEALEAIRRASEIEPKSAFYKRQVRRFASEVGA